MGETDRFGGPARSCGMAKTPLQVSEGYCGKESPNQTYCAAEAIK